MRCPYCGKDIYAHIKNRNEKIIDAVLAGDTYKAQAEKYGLSPSRVSKIVRKSKRAQAEYDRRYQEWRQQKERAD